MPTQLLTAQWTLLVNHLTYTDKQNTTEKYAN